MKKNNIKVVTMNTINNTGNTILRGIRFIKGYNYNAPIAFYEINGPFTVNQIKKEVDNAGYNVHNAIITVLLKDDYFDNEYNLAELTIADTVNTDFNYVWFDKIAGAEIHRYIAKGDFNEDRKKENAHAFVICQLKENIKKPAKKEVDLTNRFKVTHVNKRCKACGGTSYIGDIETTICNAAGQKYTRKHTFTCTETKLENIIDKSGYFVDIKREDLKQRAKKLRADRAKNAYQATNNAAKIETLENIIAAKKAAIVKALNDASTATEVKTVCEKLNRWNGLPDIITSFETLKIRDTSKDYATIKDFETRYNDIMNKINEL